MSVAHSYNQTPSTRPYPLTDTEQQNIFIAHPQDIPRAMNSSHLTGALPGQPPMLNLYGGPPHQPQQPFHTMPHQQQSHPPQATHPALGMMSSNPTYATSPGMQSTLHHTLQQQPHPQNTQQRMQMLQQRSMPGGPGLMGNPNPQMQQGLFPPGMNPGMRRISTQTQPVPQGPNPMAMGHPLRPGQHNPRMLGTQPPAQSHEMSHLMAMARAPSQVQQQQPPMVNGMQHNPISRPTPGGQLNQPPHPLSHQQQPQHRLPFQTPSGMSPHHAPSPTRPPSHHGPSPVNNVNPHPGPQPAQNMFPLSNAPHPSQQHSQRASGPFPFHPDGNMGQPAPHNPPHSAMGSSNSVPTTHSRLPPPPQPFNLTHTHRGGSQEPFAHVLPSHTATPHQGHRILSGQQPIPGPSRPDTQPQAGPSRSPRPPSRHPNQPPQQRPSPLTQAPSHVRPASATSPINRRTSAGLSAPTQAPVTGEPQPLPVAPAPLRPTLPFPTNLVGNGQGVLRVMEFSSSLADENCDRLKFGHWEKMTENFFAPLALWKLTLWKDNERREAKLFELNANVLSMLLLVSSQSGVRSMNLILDGVKERALNPGTSVVDCPSAQWVWRFVDGHVISLRGTFSCQVSAYRNVDDPPDRPPMLKFDAMTFDSNSHEKLLALDSIRGARGFESVQRTPATTTQGSPDNASSSSSNTVKTEEGSERHMDIDSRVVIEHALLPPDPVNAFGIPQASMRCLELAESVGQMAQLFDFCQKHGVGPQDGLIQLGSALRKFMPPAGRYIPMSNGIPEHALSSSSLKENSVAERRATRPSSQPAPPATPTQSGPAQASPRPPPLPGTSKMTPNTSGGVAAPSGPLKRKAQQPPETGGSDAQPPAKRMTRRKSKAG